LETKLGCITEERVYEGFLGGNHGLLLLTPCGASEGLQEGELLFCLLFKCFNMLVEVEVCVKSDTQDLGVWFQGE